MFHHSEGAILQCNPDARLPLNVGRDEKQLCEALFLIAVSARADSWACTAPEAFFTREQLRKTDLPLTG